MSSLPNRGDQYLQELIAGKALGDLSSDELLEFAELFSGTEAKDLQELELAAAALQLALTEATMSNAADAASDTNLPESLRQRIVEDSLNYISLSSNQYALHSPAHADLATLRNQALDDFKSRPKRDSRINWREAVAWFAVAASLLIAAQLWLGSDKRKQQMAQAPTAAEARQALLKNAQSIMRLDWSNGTTPFESAVTGDVVWNNSSQQGYMRFVGMPPNYPQREQYQLWIIDPERDAEPIDGGVFDIASTGEVVVPIQAKLKVLKPAAFAITIEQPGGVVVSTQARLPLLAKVLN